MVAGQDEQFESELKNAVAGLRVLIYPLNRIFALEGPRASSTWWRCFLLLGIFPVLIMLVCLCEGTVTLENGVGLSQHTGFLAMFVGNLLMVAMLRRTFGKCSEVLAHMGHVVDWSRIHDPGDRQQLHDAIGWLGKLKSDRRALRLWQCCGIVVGAGAVLRNAFDTRIPKSVYGQDVWDSVHHTFGYVAGRAYFTVTWAIVTPLAVVGLLGLCYVMWRVFRGLAEVGDHGVLKVRPMAFDGVGGLAHVNQAIMAIVLNLLPWVVMFAALRSRWQTQLLDFSAVGLSGALLVIFFAPAYAVHVAMARTKQMRIQMIERAFSLVDEELTDSLTSLESTTSSAPSGQEKASERLWAMHERAKSMPEWPFRRFGASGPLLASSVPIVVEIARHLPL